jgi:hypothetical protein
MGVMRTELDLIAEVFKLINTIDNTIFFTSYFPDPNNLLNQQFKKTQPHQAWVS